MPDDHAVNEFLETLWRHYDAYGRSMPWRDDYAPYRVLVSEIMLQQTGVERVIPKFTAFMERFPAFAVLAAAPLTDVLGAWQGLGYNRRARFLHEAAKRITEQGMFPETLDGLTALPGVGKNTAGAILAYAFDTRSVFVETNIRSILFHHFFDGREGVSDTELMGVMERIVPHEDVRHFYWAMMDYGTYLKRTAGTRNDVSRHYKKQSPLSGSVREVRGQIIRRLTEGSLGEAGLRRAVSADGRFDTALAGLVRDGLVQADGDRIRLTG